MFRDAGLGDIPRIAYAADAAATWTLADVDWAALPSLLARARQVLDAPDAATGLIEISRKARGLGQPTIEWEISLELPQRESGRVTLDNAGGIRRVQWPHGREPAANLLDPALARRFVEALAHDAGPHAGVMQIMLRPDGASATIRDPRKPAALLELGYAGVLLETSSIPNAPAGFWQGERYDDEWMFDLRELDATVLDGLPALQRAALGRLKIGGGAVAWISIGRHRTTFEGNRRLLAEVGVAGPDRQSGRVFLDARTGALLRLYGP